MTTGKRLLFLVIILSLFFPALSGGETAWLYRVKLPWEGEGKVQNLSEGIKKIDLYLFHSEECKTCRSILPGLTEKLEAMYPSLAIKLLDLKDPGSYETLRDLERRLGKRGEELPFAVIGSHFLSGAREVTERLDLIVLEYLLKEPPQPILTRPKSHEDPSLREVSAELIYFYQNGCAKCGRTDVLLDHLSRRYPKLSMKKIDISTPEGKQLNEAVSERLNLPDKYRLTAPAILIGKEFLLQKEITEERLDAILLNIKQNPSSFVIPPEEMKRAERSILERFKSMGPIPIAFAGLIDGLNPCAFATLIFFISYLTIMGKKKREVLRVGLGFTASVFITYLLIGLGLISLFQHFPFPPFLLRSVYLLTAVFALIMGGLSFYDFLMWKRGKAEKMKLQLPKPLKKLIHKTVRKVDLSKYHLPGAIFLGFVISLFEFTCTGQVYLPTIIFAMSISELKGDALVYLLLYNLAFIIPLISVFGLFYLGISQESFARFLRNRGALIKLITSAFFFLLGGTMLAILKF
jgi:cytochrome c biogenesis protein CcdA